MLKALGLALKMSVAGVLVLPAAVTPVSVFAQQQQNATAAQLAEGAERATALLIKAARESQDPTIAPGASKSRPFWTALKDLNTAVTQMANGQALKDDSFHRALGETISKGLAVATAYEMIGGRDPNVEKAYDKLEKIVSALQTNYSKAAARKRQGGELSAQEKSNLDAIKQKQAQLEERLNKIEPKLKGNARAMRGVVEVRKRVVEVRGARDTVGDYLAALVTLRIIDGVLFGCHWWWGPWGSWVEHYSFSSIVIYDGYLDDIAYDWGYYDGLETAIDVADLEVAVDEDDLVEAQEFMEAEDFDDATLDDDDLAGIDEPTSEDLEDLALDVGDADALPAEDDDALVEEELDTGSEELPLEEGLEPVEGDLEPLPEDLDEVPVPEPMPEVEDLPVPEQLPEVPELPAEELVIDESPLEEPIPGDFGVGIEDNRFEGLPEDDFGGGFDDGGFDDMGGDFGFD